MIGSGKTVGVILMAAGVVILVIVSLFIGSGLASGEASSISAVILGIGLFGVLPLLILGGLGAYLFTKGQTEERELAGVRKKERLLGLIQAQGKAPLNSIIVELKMTRDEVKQSIYELVQQGLFTGYIDWSTNTFFSKDAAQVASNKCPNCGGVRELVGQGIVKCQYCGAELFIPPGAPQTTAAPAPPPAAQ